MDPLTHTLTGAVLADTGLGKRTARATATLLVAVNLPDVDVLSYAFGGDAALGFRRGWTHGVLALAAMPALLAAAVVLVDRLRGVPAASFRRLLPLAYLGALTHPFLDWLNTYGIRLLMPFSPRWYYGDTLFIIDPWVWLGLGGAVFLRHSRSRRSLAAWTVLGALTSLLFVTGSAGHPGARGLWFGALALLAALRAGRRLPNDTPAAERLARGTLLGAALYVGVLHAGSVLARHDVESRLPALGVAFEDVLVSPVPIRPLAHAVVIDTGSEYRLGSYDWFGADRFQLAAKSLPRPPAGPAVAAAFGAPCLAGMVSWVRYPWVEIERDEGGTVVYLMDARYTRARTRGFGGASVRLRPDLTPVCEAGDP